MLKDKALQTSEQIADEFIKKNLFTSDEHDQLEAGEMFRENLIALINVLDTFLPGLLAENRRARDCEKS